MAFTIIGYSAAATVATLANIAGLADQHVRVSGNDIIVPELTKVIGVYAMGSTITQARLSSPSLRRLAEPDIEPIDTGLEPTSPTPIHDLRATPWQLDRSEALNFQTISATGSGQTYGIVLLSDGKLGPIPTGQLLSVRCTNTTTLTANAWTNGALTFAQTLPAGRYAVVGMRAQSAGLVAARIVIPGENWRPGCIGYDSDVEVEDPMFRMGRMGNWGEFEHNEPPTVDFLSISADSAQVVHLDLVKIK